MNPFMLDKPKHYVLKGHFENSPAFERRDLMIGPSVPKGRLNRNVFSAVPAGLANLLICPGIEMPDYPWWFLPNGTPA